MKKTLLNFSIAFLFVLIPTFLIILTLSILTYNGLLSFSISKTILYISSILLFFLFSFIYGIKIKHHGLLHGVILILLYLAISLLLIKSDMSIFIIIAKCLCLLFGTISGVNISNRKE